MKLWALAFTDRGMATGAKIPGLASLTRCPQGGLGEWTALAWQEADGLLFIGAAGIAVRAVAPFLKRKTQDRAVLVLDEGGRFIIPILSGHIGGANAMALEIGRHIGATPVITTATDGRGLFAVDVWAVSQNLSIANPGAIKTVSAKLLAGERVGIVSDFPISGDYPPGVTPGEPGDISVCIKKEASGLRLVPRCITLGIGCRKGAAQAAIEDIYREAGFSDLAIQAVATIDLKADEPGLLAFCREHGFPLRTYSPRQLQSAPGCFTASEFVKSVTGVDNVCERSAAMEGGTLVLRKTAKNGVTLAAAITTPALSFGGSGT